MSTSRIPRLSTNPPHEPPRTERPASRTLLSSSAASSSGYGLSSSTTSRLPSTTGRAPALRSSRLPLSSSLSSSTSSMSGGGRASSGLDSSYRSGGGSGSVLGKRGSGLADLDEDAASSANKQIYATQAKIMGLERTITEHRAKETEHNAIIEEQQNEIYKLKSERRMLADRNGKERKTGEEQEGKWYEERQKEISSLRLRLSSIESSSAQIQSERDQAVGELALIKQTRAREMATFEDQIKTLEAEVNALKGWQHRSQSLSISLEEQKRKAEEREERWRVEKRNSIQPVQGPGGAGGGGAGVGEGGEEGVVGKQEMQRLREEIKGLSQRLQMQQNSRKALDVEVAELKKGKKEAETDKRMIANTANDLKLEVRSLREQLLRSQQDMDSLTRTFPDTPSSPTIDYSTLQNRLSTLSELHKTTTDELATTKLELEQTHARLTETTARAHAANVEMTQRLQTAEMEGRWAKEGRIAAERRERLALDELDIVRDTTSRAMPGGGSFGDDAARVSQLEQVVDMYKKQLDEMQRDSKAAEERIVEGRGLVKQAVLDEVEAMLRERQALIAEQEQRIAELEAANATLDAEVSDAARRLASGAYDPSRMRVLEFANNPAAKIKMTRLHELQELKDENEALLQALSELEDAKGLSNDEGDNQGQEDGTARRYVPRQSFDRLVKEKKDLEESREKRVLRLKEIFGAKSKEFLEAVYSLLGWKIKFDESGRDIRLTSMYAPKGKMGLTLKFASNEGHFGTMQMTGAMAKGLEEARRFWIEERQSVPGFLAQVTTECFEKTTIGRASGYVGLE